MSPQDASSASMSPAGTGTGSGSSVVPSTALQGTGPQDIVERALAAARSDDCIVIADESSTANLRWAGNTLTTNGVARSRQLTVIAVSRRATGTSVGVVSRAGVRDDQVEDVVRAAEQAAARRLPRGGRPAAAGAGRRRGAEDLGRGALGRSGGGHRDRRVQRVRGGSGRRVRGRAGRRAQALRVRRALAERHVPRHVDRPAAAPRPAVRQGRAEREVRGPGPLGLGGLRHPGLQRRRRRVAGRRPASSGWPGPSGRSTCRPGGTRRCSPRGPWPTCWSTCTGRPGPRTRWTGAACSASRGAAPGSASGCPACR